MKPREYTEGPEAMEKFKSLASAILQAPSKKKKHLTSSRPEHRINAEFAHLVN